jgi:hypothetical protein
VWAKAGVWQGRTFAAIEINVFATRCATRTACHAGCHAEIDGLWRVVTDWDGSPNFRVLEQIRKCWRAPYVRPWPLIGSNLVSDQGASTENLDEGTVWPVAFALKELTAADEARIGALVKKAVSF